MYWKKENRTINGTTYILYQYFTLEPRPIPTNKFYNPITKQEQHPVTLDLNINQRIALSEDDFLTWYATHVKL